MSPGLKRGGSRLSKLGGLESRSESTTSCDAITLPKGEAFRSPPGRATTGSPRPRLLGSPAVVWGIRPKHRKP